jgi:multisubunit Na+/H+ antiporter MnhE subunit
MKTAFIHIGIAIVWMFLNPHRDLPSLIIGLLIGWALLVAFRPLLPNDRYLKQSTAFFKWLWAFFVALVLSQIRVARIILFLKHHPIQPGFFEFPLRDLSDIEILMLSHSISLTPGTTSVDVIPDRNVLLIHALEADNPKESIREIEETLLKPLLALTRP